MRIRFQADADLNHVILSAAIRREPKIDFQTATAANLESVKDPEVLAIAAKEGRVLVTHDQRTMPLHFASFIRSAASPGIIVIPQSFSLSLAVEELLLIWAAMDAEEWINRIVVFPL